MLVTQSCPALCDPIYYSPPCLSAHGILQARTIEWVAIPFSRGASWPRNQTRVSYIAGRFFTSEPPGKPFATLATMLFCESGVYSPCPPQSRFRKYVKIQLKLHLFWDAFPGRSGFTVLSEVLLFTVYSTHPNSFHFPLLFNSSRQHTASKCLNLSETIVIQQWAKDSLYPHVA